MVFFFLFYLLPQRNKKGRDRELAWVSTGRWGILVGREEVTVKNRLMAFSQILPFLLFLPLSVLILFP